MNQKESVPQQIERQLAGYRQWLAELDQEARQPGGDLTQIDGELWEIFNPRLPLGRQICESYTDEELLSVLLPTMDHQGHKPRLEEVYCVYREYLRVRFGSLGEACRRARSWRKRWAEEQAWPADWPDRLMPDRLLDYLGRRGQPVTGEDREIVASYCAQLRCTACPPDEARGPQALLRLLQRSGCSWRRAMERLNAPVLNKIALRHMNHYWAHQRSAQTLAGNPASKRIQKGGHTDETDL